MTGDRQFRTFTLDITSADTNDGIAVALSSEAPVERYDYATGERFLEVLDHSEQGPDLSMSADGLPLLLDHDLGRQVGIVHDVRVDRDRRLRGVLKPGNHPDAEWLFEDLRAGIRNKVSIGYTTAGAKHTTTRRTGELPIRRYTEWLLLEASSVAVPADYSVGVGRASPKTTAPRGASRITVNTENLQTQDPEGRVRELTALASSNDSYLGTVARLPQWIASGKSVDDVRAEIMTEYRSKQPSPPSPNPYGGFDAYAGAQTATVDESAFREALFAPDGAAARKTTAGLARELGITPRGNLVPIGLGAISTRTLTTNTATTGLELTPAIQRDLIDLLRNRSYALRYARVVNASGGTFTWPRKTAGATSTWAAENGTAVAASDPTFNAMTLRPKALRAVTVISEESRRASTPATEFVVRQDHADQHAVALDAAILAGAAGGNNPVGVLFSSGVGLVAMGMNGAVMSYAKLAELEQTLDAANANMEALRFFTTPGVRARMRQIQRFSGTDSPLWESDSRVLGYEAFSTNNLPSNLVKGSSGAVCHAALLGDLSEVVVGMWGGLEVIVDPYTSASSGLTRVITNLYVDVGVRTPGSFGVIRDILLA